MLTPDEKRVYGAINKEGSFEHLIDAFSALQFGERAATEDSLAPNNADSGEAQPSISNVSDQQQQDIEEVDDVGIEEFAEACMDTYRALMKKGKLSFSENQMLGELHSVLSDYYLSDPQRFNAQFNTVDGQLQSGDQEMTASTPAMHSCHSSHSDQGVSGDPWRQCSPEATRDLQTSPFFSDDIGRERPVGMSDSELERDATEKNHSADPSSMGKELGAAGSSRQRSNHLESRTDNATPDNGSLVSLCPVSHSASESASNRATTNNDLVDGWGSLRRSTLVIIQCGPHDAAKYRFEYRPNYKNDSLASISDRTKRISALEDIDSSGNLMWRYTPENVKDVAGVVAEARNPCKDYETNPCM
ncbi:hypothetical protein N7509_000220 [Penicillium cosmopolitanum]|uniref:Uncharacterized protein n=1 Tax=Penicillium cosmopolitanum TaxID=1131564 RepID=A0A9X0BF38_9EURO|nr:uncharacterized protein N7509_000220 [Penicillium cosmopolitanum]KAJ5414886.1 hypothetical protein N7509_000220 [Penicillium cosmopolitanum]